jgi:large subunit ribosomal protein L24
MKLHIRKGDNVRVLSGRDRGKEGRVMLVFPQTQKAIVEGINLVQRHLRPDQENPQGGIQEQEAPIHVSKLMVLDGGEPTRVGRKKSENGKGWERYSKKTGETI